MPHRFLTSALVAAALAAGASTPAHADPPIWETSFGSPLGLSDDSTFETTFGAQNFSFPFAGAVRSGATPLSISSNGFVSIGGSNGDECCDGSVAFLLNDAFGRVAPFFTDLQPGTGGGNDVYLNVFNDAGGASNDRVVVTWATIHFSNGLPVTVQVQMKSDGTFIFGYNGYNMAGVFRNVLVGTSPAGGASDPGNRDYTATLPFHTGSQATIYELFAQPNPPVDLDQTNIVFNPDGLGGYRVTPTFCKPRIWEDNYGTRLNQTDDSTFETTFGGQNFIFPFNGTVYSGASPLSISSNGFVSIGGSNFSGCCGGNPFDLVNNSFGRVAAFWTDLYPPGGGDVFVNSLSNLGGPPADRLVITWDTVHIVDLRPIAVQMQLLKDGTIIVGFQCSYLRNDVFEDILTGVSPGGGVTDPGNRDYSGTVPFVSGIEPTVYEQWTGNPPPFDLAGTNLVFEPDGVGGYRVSTEFCRPRIWENRFGAPLGLTDDSTFETTFGAQNFSFPFGGTTFSGGNVLSIASNGFISIGGNNGAACCSGDPNQLVNDAFGRVATFWADLIPGFVGDVYLNAFDDWGSSATDRLVVTWDTDLYDNAGASRFPITVQAQLLSNGTIVMGYRCPDFIGFNDDTLIGVSPGAGAFNPGSTDFSASIPFSSGIQPTSYELFTGGPPPIDLLRTNLVFEPTGTGGYHVDRVECGAGTVDATHSIADVLRINASTGTPISRVVTVARNAPITVSLAASPQGPPANARYVLWAWIGSNVRPTEVTSGPNRLGCAVNPTPLNNGQNPQPFRCLMGAGLPPAVCHNVQQLAAPSFAPWSITRGAGFSHAIRVTIQGALRDNGAANGVGYSMTNAVVLNVP